MKNKVFRQLLILFVPLVQNPKFRCWWIDVHYIFSV